MSRKRPERTARRADERTARALVRKREKLASLSAGGAQTHPIEVESSAVIEGRACAQPCVQCEGSYRVVDHRSAGPGVRAVDVRCERCGAPRTWWFKIVAREPN